MKQTLKPTSTTATGPATFEQAVKALEASLTAPNPYAVAPATETTKSAKIRLDLAHRFEIARERFENAQKRSTGIVGFYGRMSAIGEAIAILSSKMATDSTVKFKELADLGDQTFIAHNPDRKLAPNSARVYAQAAMELLHVLGLVVYSPKAKAYSITPQFRQILQARK